MKTWQFILETLEKGQRTVLLYVLDSEGSSPGRQGFKMAVAPYGKICGTIGGGIMEHKLVEYAKTLLEKNEEKVFLKPQFHDKKRGENQSGMICSGHQYVAFVPLQPTQKKIITNILQIFKNQEKGYIQISPKGLNFSNKSFSKEKLDKIFEYKNEEAWTYSERLNSTPVIHIIGGGHVGLALSQVMSMLGFYIKIYDNRANLNTMNQNYFAHEKILVDYEKIDQQMNFEEQDFLAVMTFGYRTDKQVIECLLDKKFAYFGVMGSQSKMNDLLDELEMDGFSKRKLNQLKTPIGINIFSKTATEIGISVAAEIIKEKNSMSKNGNRVFSERQKKIIKNGKG